MIKATVDEKFRFETQTFLTELAECFRECDISLYGFVPDKLRTLANELGMLKAADICRHMRGKL